MRTWIKDGARLLTAVTALAGVGAVLAYSGVSTDRYTLPTERDDRTEDSFTSPVPDTSAEAELPGTSPLTRPRMAGAAGLAVAALGVGMIIRRRRRRGAHEGS